MCHVNFDSYLSAQFSGNRSRETFTFFNSSIKTRAAIYFIILFENDEHDGGI